MENKTTLEPVMEKETKKKENMKRDKELVSKILEKETTLLKWIEEESKLRAEKYEKEYAALEEEKLKKEKESEEKGVFYIPPEPKVAIVIRIRGVTGMPPKPRKALKLMRLRQIHNAVFIRLNASSLKLLKIVEPYVAWGYPSLQTIRSLIYKRGFAKISGQRVAFNDNVAICKKLKKYDIVCAEDLVHEIFMSGEHFKEANNFLWPFKLDSPRGGYRGKLSSFVQGGDAGNREDLINDFLERMI